MKKVIIALLIFPLFFNLADAQDRQVIKKSNSNSDILKKYTTTKATPENIFNYDFNGKSLTPLKLPEHMRRGMFYTVEITNINQNLYKVSINHKDSTISKALEMPTFESFKLDALTNLISGISPQSETKREINPNARLYITLQERIENELEKQAEILREYLGDLSSVKTGIDDIQLESSTFVLNELKLAPETATGFDYNRTLKEALKLRKEINTAQSEILVSQEDYNKFSEKNKGIIEKNKDLKSKDTIIKTSYSELVTKFSEAQNTISAEKVKELLATLIISQNNSEKIYCSFPIQFTEEQATIDILIEPRKPEYLLQSYKTSLTFPFDNLHYAAVGVSFYAATLHDDAFSVVSRLENNTVVYDIKQEKLAKAEVGITTLLRIGKKIENPGWLGWHGSVGPGISISDKIKPRILVGGGLSAGFKHMFTFDVGGIFGYVDRLSSAYDDGSSGLLSKPESVIVSKLSGGGFVALGYLYKF